APRVEQLLARGAEDTADIVAALVLLLALCGISLGLLTLFRQLAATALLIRTLVAQKVALPPSLLAAADGLHLEGRIDLVADERPFSFCYWFVRPRICLSTALVERLDSDELRAVLHHERYHLRQRDPLRQVVARYFAAGLYVVPVVDELLTFHTLQKEIEADQEAVRASGGVRSLASALYKLLPDADDVSLGLLVPVSSLSVTEARIDQLVAGQPLSVGLSPLSSHFRAAHSSPRRCLSRSRVVRASRSRPCHRSTRCPACSSVRRACSSPRRSTVASTSSGLSPSASSPNVT